VELDRGNPSVTATIEGVGADVADDERKEADGTEHRRPRRPHPAHSEPDGRALDETDMRVLSYGSPTPADHTARQQ
jgi:hypothetical protein